MADEGDAGEKTETATSRRREEFRERGQVARSQDVLSLLILAVGLSYFSFFGFYIFGKLSAIFQYYFSYHPHRAVDGNEMIGIATGLFDEMASILFPLVAGVVVFGILGNVLQVGIIITLKPLEPKLDKLNFFGNFIKTFFNRQAVGNLVGGILKMGFIGIVIYFTLNGDGPHIAALPMLPLEEGLSWMLDRILVILLNIVMLLIVIAVADYTWQVFSMEKQMMMSKQEVKDEHKMTEGNPQIKGQRRRRALEMFNQRMMSAVPGADVVINNPTHFSVALRYTQGLDAAPVIVAKGADLLALRIRRLAEIHDVPMVEDPKLARSLYREVKVGRTVPLHFYRAVAEVLAYVYRLKHGPAKRMAPPPR